MVPSDGRFAMAKKPTFAQMLAEERSKPVSKPVIRRGHFNLEGQFFDPEGRLLEKVRSDITPKQAREAFDGGALVAFEGCGCGGQYGGCSPEWISADLLGDAKGPRFVKGYGSPTWIDEWAGEDVSVVFLHGDVAWGDVLA